ncbi:multidrug efflux MFS transporter [Lactobacillus sp. PV037]|uniref:MFS transporter n=1 Tax=Lactobacillus sp. PV037 TaxID=2594496 RepID=UPI00223F515F|nr:MFS transporter [Lactobacillus sp. PV037]QNQ84026.1 multidrug efflux MFS transporter [Lactobacillus sp. PV037]
MESKRLNRKLLIAILSAGILSFLGILDETATTVTFPILINEFSVTTGQVQWVNTIVLLVIAVIVPISSQIKLRFSTKNIFLSGILIFMMGLLIDIVSPRFDFLLLGRIFQGIGTGIGLPLMYNIILEKVPKAHLDFMMGIGTMITAAAVAIGPVFGGIITQRLNWRWIFIISFILGTIGLISGLFTIPQLSLASKKVHFKVLQWVTLGIGLILLIIGFTNFVKNSLLSYKVSSFIIGGIISLIIWGKLSWRDKNPLINPKIFQDITFTMQLVCYCIAKISTLALGFALPLYIELVNFGSSSIAGWILLPGAIADAIMAAVGGKILAKRGNRLPIISGTFVSLLSLSLLFLSTPHLTNTLIIFLYILYYGGYGLSFSTLMTSGLTALTKKEQAEGNAIYNTLQQFSGAVGTALAGSLIAISQKATSQSLANGTAQGNKRIFITLILLISLSLVIEFFFIPKSNK